MGQGRRERDEGRREIKEGEREGQSKERRGKAEGWGWAKGRVGDCSKGMAGMA
jgi:hypothetical protein